MQRSQIVQFYKGFHGINEITEDHEIDIDCLASFERKVIERVNVLTALARQAPQANKDTVLVQFTLEDEKDLANH